MVDFQHGVRTARDLAEAYTPLFPAVEQSLLRADVYSNLEVFNKRFHQHHQDIVFATRVANLDEIGLVRWPEGALVLGRNGYPTRVGDFFVEEQIAPWLETKPDDLETVWAEMSNPTDVNQECLLLARFGEGTWGHWLGEILPRAVMAEEFFPGRFSFAVPGWTTSGSGPGMQTAVLQSLAAYGITETRLIRLASEKAYRFKSLSTVTSVRSDRAMHPQALDLMRRNVIVESSAFDRYLPSRLALLRKHVGRRAISNYDEVEKVLSSRGFLVAEAETMPFQAQVAVFRCSHDLFCVLGSGLTNLIYSPEYVNVIAPAPEDWGDSFFYPLVQARNGKFADIRGPCTELNETLLRDSKFSVPIDQLQIVLELMKIS